MNSRFIVTTSNTCMHPTHVHDRPIRPMSPDSRYSHSQPERSTSAIRKQCTCQIRTTASNQVIPSLSTKTSSSSTSSGTSDVRRQEVQSRRRQPVSRAKMCPVADWRAEVVDTMSPCDHHVSRHRYPRLRSRRIASVSDPLSIATVQDTSLGAMVATAEPPLRRPTVPTHTHSEPFSTFITKRHCAPPHRSHLRKIAQHIPGDCECLRDDSLREATLSYGLPKAALQPERQRSPWTQPSTKPPFYNRRANLATVWVPNAQPK